MKAFVLDLHWERRTPHPDKPLSGKQTYVARGRRLSDASRAASKKFIATHGANLRITSIKEKPADCDSLL